MYLKAQVPVSVTLTVTDPATVKEMSSSVSVSQLATSQTLVLMVLLLQQLWLVTVIYYSKEELGVTVYLLYTNFPERTVSISSSAIV